MLLPAPPLYPRKKRSRVPSAGAAPTPPPVVGPVLLSATFDPDNAYLTLGFDRAIEVSGFVPDETVVDDGNFPIEWGGTADLTLLDPNTLRIGLIQNAEYEGTGVKL